MGAVRILDIKLIEGRIKEFFERNYVCKNSSYGTKLYNSPKDVFLISI